jgi:hypothetical protein
MIIIYIPACVIALATFPGVILHEIAHKFFCDIYRVPVYEVKYFAASKNAGHVIHEPIDNSKKNAIIGLAPLLINSIVCVLFLIPHFLPFLMGSSFVSTYTPLDIFLIWVGLSCGLNALPSEADLAHIDKNISWPLICIKKIAQTLNFCEFVGNFFWLAILFFILILFFLILGSVLFLIIQSLLLIDRTL